jgi:hypothetical protein
MRETTKHAE